MRKVLLLIFVAISASAMAQVSIGLSRNGDPLAQYKNIQRIEARGDLDRDGVEDMAAIIFVRNKNLLEITEGGDTIDHNHPLLMILKGRSDGTFASWKQYSETLPAKENPFEFIDYDLSINDRGVMRIGMSHFMSAGGWGNTNQSYAYRWQNGDFYLIGKDENGYQRNTGESEEVSYNYLTNKKQVILSNVFDDSVKPKEKWTKIPKEPLRKLGSEELGE